MVPCASSSSGMSASRVDCVQPVCNLHTASMESKHAQRSKATRDKLVSAARALFGERGYGAVGTEEVVRAAGVTRGALYHQFRDKEDLFEAVFEEVEAETTQRIAEGALASA